MNVCEGKKIGNRTLFRSPIRVTLYVWWMDGVDSSHKRFTKHNLDVNHGAIVCQTFHRQTKNENIRPSKSAHEITSWIFFLKNQRFIFSEFSHGTDFINNNLEIFFFRFCRRQKNENPKTFRNGCRPTIFSEKPHAIWNGYKSLHARCVSVAP